MASTSTVPVRESRIRPKHVVFAMLAAMFLFVLWHDERFIIVHSHPNFAYYFPVRWFIIPHGLAGLAALLMGPFSCPRVSANGICRPTASWVAFILSPSLLPHRWVSTCLRLTSSFYKTRCGYSRLLALG